MVKVDDLHKHYGDFAAVDGISFHVPRGEVFGFLGPNGAGKTTTMRIIAGLLRATSGNVQVGGHDVVRDAIAAKSISSYIPDRPFLYEKLTAFEFLEFVGGLHRMGNADIADRGVALLERFELGRWADALIEGFSHGMKQRLVFCAALLTEPQLLVVDEPMVGLDPRGARLVKEILREHVEGQRGSVLVSTHSMDVAEEICDRIAIVFRGRIAALGTIDELRDRADQPGSNLEEIFLRLTDENQADSPGELADKDSAQP
ncbi:MAG: ABC transporter ATP-binding protein [Nannocystaceae bacterium]|nr:ABC transporter ATP-binding protein [Nannocystaceae bacterium]